MRISLLSKRPQRTTPSLSTRGCASLIEEAYAASCRDDALNPLNLPPPKSRQVGGLYVLDVRGGHARSARVPGRR